MIRVEYNAMFVAELRGFAGLERKQILGHMRSIEKAPLATAPNRIFLPPMWRPGTVQAHFGDIRIRFFVSRDDETGITTVVFLRVYREQQFDPTM